MMIHKSELFEPLSSHYVVKHEWMGSVVLQSAGVSWHWKCTGRLPIGRLPSVTLCSFTPHCFSLPTQHENKTQVK